MIAYFLLEKLKKKMGDLRLYLMSIFLWYARFNDTYTVNILMGDLRSYLYCEYV